MKNSKPANKEPATIKNGTPESVKDGFLIVGIGASAGGIQALQEFFNKVPADSGMAYVVILHLSPDHDSKLAEVLQEVTPLLLPRLRKKRMYNLTMYMWFHQAGT